MSGSRRRRWWAAVRADCGLAYVHAASTEFLTAMHTGGRTKDDIDADVPIIKLSPSLIGYCC